MGSHWSLVPYRNSGEHVEGPDAVLLMRFSLHPLYLKKDF